MFKKEHLTLKNTEKSVMMTNRLMHMTLVVPRRNKNPNKHVAAGWLVLSLRCKSESFSHSDPPCGKIFPVNNAPPVNSRS